MREGPGYGERLQPQFVSILVVWQGDDTAQRENNVSGTRPNEQLERDGTGIRDCLCVFWKTSRLPALSWEEAPSMGGRSVIPNSQHTPYARFPVRVPMWAIQIFRKQLSIELLLSCPRKSLFSRRHQEYQVYPYRRYGCKLKQTGRAFRQSSDAPETTEAC